MNRVFITSDTHGHIDIQKLNSRNFPIGKELDKTDYLIICGDFGLVWDNDKEELYWRKWLNDRNWTTLFVDGNHENIPLINTYPIVKKHNGKMHQITDSIYHLMRGEIYDIYGKSFACMGGATSYDKELRTEGINWWKEELPNKEEYENLLMNLERYKYNVDYMLTHTCPTTIKAMLGFINKNSSCALETFLENLSKDLTFKKWYFGHFHVDKSLYNYRCLYNDVVEIDG
jgi:hypothetical protein